MTRRRRWMLGAILAGVSAWPGAVWADSSDRAAESIDRGLALLVKADFDAALAAFAEAAKAVPDKQEYRQQYALVRRIIKMRKRIDRERNPEKWETTAQALRSFYYDHEIYSESLALDRMSHARLGTAASAARLAETELNLGMNDEAAGLLTGLSPEEATLQTRAYLGIALARQDRLAEAKAVAKECEANDEAGPGLCFDLARLYALLGDTSQAAGLLTRAFELTPPSRLASFKDYAKKSNDFDGLMAAAEITKALDTASKVKESKCSTGTDCGKCPSKTKCSTASAKKPTKTGH
ncbi:MAG: hypothetical protein GY778_17205 [bacterium]|nr:hypothetical protein [bacterium]